MDQPMFFSTEWATAVRDALTAGPTKQQRVGKLDEYWDFYELIKSLYPASWALGCRDLPPSVGKAPSYLTVRWDAGSVISCQITGPDDPLDATYVLDMDYQGWRELHDGFDPQRTVMYRKILLEDGDLLEFFKTIYFFVECLAIIGKVSAQYPEAT